MLLNEFLKEHKPALEEQRKVEKCARAWLLFHAVMLTALNIALVLARLDHVGSSIVNATHSHWM